MPAPVLMLADAILARHLRLDDDFADKFKPSRPGLDDDTCHGVAGRIFIRLIFTCGICLLLRDGYAGHYAA